MENRKSNLPKASKKVKGKPKGNRRETTEESKRHRRTSEGQPLRSMPPYGELQSDGSYSHLPFQTYAIVECPSGKSVFRSFGIPCWFSTVGFPAIAE